MIRAIHIAVLVLLLGTFIAGCKHTGQMLPSGNVVAVGNEDEGFHLTAEDEAFLEELQKRTFLFFWENTDVKGFTIESTAWPVGSIASTGFYLTAIPIGIEHGWITHEEGLQAALTTLNNYYDDPNDSDDFYVESERGFFPHWFDQITGYWNGIDVFSSIDTAILMAGVLTVRQYFAGTEIETLATALFDAVDWTWMLNGRCTLSMGWKPDTGFIAPRWHGLNEGSLAVLLALGSRTHSFPDECDGWGAWVQTYQHVEHQHGDEVFRFIESNSTALFTYQYPQIWFDLRDKQDRLSIDHFENSRIATLENRAYAIENPLNHEGYGGNVWGITASECPLDENNYGAHGPRMNDNGCIAPTGAGGSILFTPEESISALRYMKETFEDRLWGAYGFYDAFNLNIDWFSNTYIGIDQGTILTMVENHRTRLIHELFMRNEYAQQALEKAGFK